MTADTLTKEEHRAYLRHSALPQLVTEGRDDFKALRLIERHIPTINIYPVGGKDTVLYLSLHQNEFPCKIAFLVDSDFWIFDGVPPQYQDVPNLFATRGYSIENDLLADVNPESLLLPAEEDKYRRQLSEVCRWFSSHVVNRPQCGEPWRCTIRKVVDDPTDSLTEEAQAHLQIFAPDANVEDQLLQHHRRLLRGKTWSSLLKRFLCRRDRHQQHNPDALMELAWSRSNGNAQRILDRVRPLLA